MTNTQTVTIGTDSAARWKRTTLDGFGRTVKVEMGSGATTTTPASIVDTEYAPCACSPLGKMYRVSQPHASGATVVWTTYTYDGAGRTVQVTAADSSASTTEYLTTFGGSAGDLTP